MMRRFYIFLALFVFFSVPGTPPAADAGQGGLIAVAADGPSAHAAVSRQAARCAYFLIFNGQGDLIESLANPHRQARGGAGPQVVEFLAQKGVGTLIAGEFGARMSDALQRKGMAMRVATGSALEAVQRAQ
jgi:predicted Fe-Mo cluster-binding NifX family protein